MKVKSLSATVPRSPIALMGVPFDGVTTAEAMSLIQVMIESGSPHYVATANVDFVTQASKDIELRRILFDAHLVLCDGMPLVWASRFLGNPLPERVTGSGMVPKLLAQAESRKWRVFLLGGAEASLEKASRNVLAKHPDLRLVGAYSPPFKPILEMDHEDILDRIRKAKPDLLLVAFGCPKQEKWINMHYANSGVPVSIGVGATIDFLAGTFRRAPVWMQKTGLEWVFRIIQEPRRLAGRYGNDLWVFGHAIIRQWWSLRSRPRRHADRHTADMQRNSVYNRLVIPERFDAQAVRQQEPLWQRILGIPCHLLVDLASVRFIDSTGVGLLIRLQKQLRTASCQMILVAPAKPVRHALTIMRLDELMTMATSDQEAQQTLAERNQEKNVVVTLNLRNEDEPVAWKGEIVAHVADQVWSATKNHLDSAQANKTFAINLAEVRFIDSTGVGLMVRAKKLGHLQGVAVVFSEVPANVRNVLQLLQLDDYLLGDPK